jgi:hypothetical protein
MTVSLQYIHRIYGDKLRKVERSAKPYRVKHQAKKETEKDTVHISTAAKKSILTPENGKGISGSILQTKLAIQAYQSVAKGLPSMLK